MKEFLKNFYKKHYSWIIAVLITAIILVCALLTYEKKKENRLIDEIDYVDSLNQYNKYYYETKFSELKKTNKKLYDSLKQYKDKIDYIVQFYHEKEYNTGKIDGNKPKVKDSVVYDTIPMIIPPIAKTYEYTSEPNDTFQYKLNVNSFTEPKWYSIEAKVKNKFTIVNKEEGGMNHIVINPENGGNITNPTVWKKGKKRSLWDRLSIGPGFTMGYDPLRKEWGMTAGITGAIDLK